MKRSVAGAAILLLCLAVVTTGCIKTKKTSTASEASSTPGPALTSTPKPTVSPVFANTPVTTATPKSTFTPKPTDTPKPPIATAVAPSPTQPLTDLLAVVAVVDGDTIKVVINGKTESIRIIGMDTPETVDQRTVVQCFGKEASARAHELLDGQKIRLVADSTQGDRDQYDRLLRYVDRADGLDFAFYMIKNGFAHEYTYNLPYQRQSAYKAAYVEARNNRAGLWSPTTCNGNTEQPAGATPVTSPVPPTATSVPATSIPVPAAATVPPATPKTTSAAPQGYNCPADYPIKGNQTTKAEWIYHMPGGAYYNSTKPEECFATEAAAQAAGYRRSSR